MLRCTSHFSQSMIIISYIQPPSTEYTLPLTNVLSGPNKKAMTLAVSSAVPCLWNAVGSSNSASSALLWKSQAFFMSGV